MLRDYFTGVKHGMPCSSDNCMDWSSGRRKLFIELIQQTEFGITLRGLDR